MGRPCEAAAQDQQCADCCPADKRHDASVRGLPSHARAGGLAIGATAVRLPSSVPMASVRHPADTQESRYGRQIRRDLSGRLVVRLPLMVQLLAACRCVPLAPPALECARQRMVEPR
jgi:hypothetical protein